MSDRAAEVFVITDCGSTTTKAILVERKDGVFRETFRGEAPTTVEAPFEDVTVGVATAIEELSAVSGRRILNEDGAIVRPARGGQGVDAYLSTSSAGGGLQMAVAGVVRRISAESAERAALGAGAIVADVVACDDPRPLHEQIERVRKLRPDMALLAGGVDGGADLRVIEMAELLAAADPRPRFGEGYRLPVIFAGNREVREQVAAAFGDKVELSAVDNIRPTVDEENLGPARDRIHEIFLDHVMRQAPGFAKLVGWTDAPVMPTPSAVGEILKATAERDGVATLCVDIGGATTDVFSVVDGVFTRTVSANLGMSYSAANVVAACGIQNVRRWLPFDLSAAEILNRLLNKTIRPTTVPDTVPDLLVEQALAREALRLSFAQHQSFATALKGRRHDMNIDKAFSGGGDDGTLVRPMAIDLIIGSGGVLSHAPHPGETAAMLIDAFLPEGVTRLAKDSIFMMPHLGVLSCVNREAALSVLEHDCLQELGTCVAPVGRTKPGRTCLSFAMRTGERETRGELAFGELRVIPLASGEDAELSLTPARGFDVGAGPGARVSAGVRGGLVGLILDGRGRPLAWPGGEDERLRGVRSWLEALGVPVSEGG
ncbi:MAG: glutamate mutase L [Deltaproteobacteria bacterium]|nr:glutamate mutase L [Deltaproteobacteria bacterium]